MGVASDPKTRLKEIIDSYLEKDGGGMIDTGIVASHLAQMKLFGLDRELSSFQPKITLEIKEKIL